MTDYAIGVLIGTIAGGGIVLIVAIVGTLLYDWWISR